MHRTPFLAGKGLAHAECCREQSNRPYQPEVYCLYQHNKPHKAQWLCEPDFFTNPKGTYYNLDTLMTAAMFLLLAIAHKSPKQNQLLCQARKQAPILLWRGCSLISPSGSLFWGTHGWIQWQLGKDGDGKDLGYETLIPCSDINSVTSRLSVLFSSLLPPCKPGLASSSQERNETKSIHTCQEL